MCYYDKPCTPGCENEAKSFSPQELLRQQRARGRRAHITRGETAELIHAVFGRDAAQTYRVGTKTGIYPS